MEQKQNELMKRDRDRFVQNLSRHDARKHSGLRSLASEKAEIEQLRELCLPIDLRRILHIVSVVNLEQLRAEKSRLSDVVKVQNLTPEEVVRMNTEHETLSRSVEDLEAKVTETNKLVMSLEVSLTNRVATAEEVIDQYNTLLSSPGLIPPNEEDLTIELNMASSDLQQLVRGPDMRKVVRPTLSKWAEMYRMEIDAAKREKIVVDDVHDHVVNECDDLIQVIVTEAAKVHALTEQAEEMREVTDFWFITGPPTSLNLGQTGCTARSCCKQRSSCGIGANDGSSKDGRHGTWCWRQVAPSGRRDCVRSPHARVRVILTYRSLRYREQQEKVARVKDETIRAIIKNSTEIAEMKEAVARQLKYVQDVVEANK